MHNALAMHQVDTSFLRRLRARDERAWFELWQAFGPVIRGTLARWGNGRLGEETLRDLTQDTLTALSDSIERFDPQRGVRFSTWLLAIAKHVLGDEMDRRYAQKRGSGRRGASLDDSWMGASNDAQPDEEYERRVLAAKVHAAIRATQKRSEFVHFEAYRMRVLESKGGRDIGMLLGVSEPTVTRHCQCNCQLKTQKKRIKGGRRGGAVTTRSSCPISSPLLPWPRTPSSPRTWRAPRPWRAPHPW